MGTLSGSYQIDGIKPSDCSSDLEYKLYIIREKRSFYSIDSLSNLDPEVDYTVYTCVIDSNGVYSEVDATTFRITKPTIQDFVVNKDGRVEFSFNQQMDSTTVHTNNVLVLKDTTLVPGKIEKVSNNQFVYTPYEEFYPSTEYKFIVKTFVRNIDGVMLDDNLYMDGLQEYKKYFFTDNRIIKDTKVKFSIGELPKKSAPPLRFPTVKRPYVSYANINPDGRVIVNFNEPVRTSTVNEISLMLLENTRVIPGSVSCMSTTECAFLPKFQLDPSRTYTVRVTTNVRNLMYGARMDQDQLESNELQEFLLDFSTTGKKEIQMIFEYPEELVHHYYNSYQIQGNFYGAGY